jgi:hypothetical protein
MKEVDCIWNVMAHVQKPDFVFWAKRTIPFKSAGVSVHSTTGSRRVLISGSNVGYTMFRGSVKSTGYPLPSPVFSSLPLPCVIVCHHISTGLYSVGISTWTQCITMELFRDFSPRKRRGSILGGLVITSWHTSFNSSLANHLKILNNFKYIRIYIKVL